MKILEYILSMENYIFPESFGPEFLLGVLKNTILEPYPKLANAQYQGNARELLAYATHGAQEQWEIAADAVAMAKGNGTKAPESDKSICYICGEPINNRLLGIANADHLLPSALGFLFFGLPGNLRGDGLHALIDPVLRQTILLTSRELSEHQFNNYAWSHSMCNVAKSAKSFVNVLALGKGCSDATTSCDIKLFAPAYNEEVIQAFTPFMSQKLANKGFTVTSGTIDQNIRKAFIPIANSLTSAFYATHRNIPQVNALQFYMMFNMYVFIIMFCVKAGQGVPPTALENIQKILHFTQQGGAEQLTIEQIHTGFQLKRIPEIEFQGCLDGIEIKKKEDESGMEQENSFPSTGVSQIKKSFLVPGLSTDTYMDTGRRGAARKHRRKTKNRKRKHKRKTRRRS